MTDSPQKPKPRPRPRPRHRDTASSSEFDKSGHSSKSLIPDEDAMFIRNKNRNANAWSRMNDAVNKREAARSHSIDPGSSDSDSPRTKRIKRQPFTPKVKELPDWTKSDGLIHIKDSDSESGSDTSIELVTEQSMKDSLEETPRTKRKKQRSRSRTESPVPRVDLAEQIGRERARQILGVRTTRTKSPVHNSDDDDVEEVEDLPAELAAIRAVVQKNSCTTGGLEDNPSPAATVEFRIMLKPHPEDESGRTYVYSHTMKRNEKFEQLFTEIADAGELPVDRLVVLYNNQRVYPWSTPRTFSIWSEADLVAYEEHVYKYIQARALTSSSINGHATAPVLADSIADLGVESDASQERLDTFKLQARLGEVTTTVTVRPTTKCSSIVANVVRKMGKFAAAADRARIMVDGEKLSPDSSIGEVDLEDGDLIDIVGA